MYVQVLLTTLEIFGLALNVRTSIIDNTWDIWSSTKCTYKYYWQH